jgi:hypothetical protein
VTPLQYFEAVWARCDELSALHAYLAGRVTAVLHPEEILRAEWVARVAALDLYVHELTAQRMIAIFEGHLPPTPAFKRFQLSNETVDRIRLAIVGSSPVVIQAPIAASNAFDLFVRAALGRKTFQYPDDIADAIRLSSTVELWNSVATHFGSPPNTKSADAKAIKTSLSLIVDRRNKIAHEGDLEVAYPRTPRAISQSDVAIVRQEIERIVRAIDAVVT